MKPLFGPPTLFRLVGGAVDPSGADGGIWTLEGDNTCDNGGGSGNTCDAGGGNNNDCQNGSGDLEA